MEVTFFAVDGEPRGKQRPKFTTVCGHARAITPQQTVQYENLIRYTYSTVCGRMIPRDTPVYVLVDTYMSIPKSTSKKKVADMLARLIRPLKKPDWDNVGKLVCDSLNTIAYHDDAAVVDGRVRKFYGEKPRVEVFISTQEIDTKLIDEWRTTK